MKEKENKFGKGNMYSIEDVKGKIYCNCAACLSVLTDFLSWANANKERMVKDANEADSLIVLGCQVTDLAVLNDLNACEELHNKFPNKKIYLSGCLAQRFDIKIYEYINRLDVVRVIGQEIEDMSLVEYRKPFWVKDFEKNDDDLVQGNLFRNFYPLKTGAGCHGKCKYCTIRHTRGEAYFTEPKEQISEFLNHDKIVLISDSPSPYQIKEWCKISKQYKKEISIRNIEPQNLLECKDEILDLADNHLLKILHCPVQSFNKIVLKAMNRNIEAAEQVLELILECRKRGVLTATNIIIDYTVNGKNFKNLNKAKLNKYFDYYSWNPYFDGKWDLEKAKERFNKYLIEENF